MGISSELEEIIHGQTVTIRETDYRVIGIQPDGQGMTTLILAI
jgi:hypothetical protein